MMPTQIPSSSKFEPQSESRSWAKIDFDFTTSKYLISAQTVYVHSKNILSYNGADGEIMTSSGPVPFRFY